MESKGKVPHLHAAICRFDENGNINSDHNLQLRAQRAAERERCIRDSIDAAFAKHEVDSDLTEWYTPEDIQEKYGMKMCIRDRCTGSGISLSGSNGSLVGRPLFFSLDRYGSTSSGRTSSFMPVSYTHLRTRDAQTEMETTDVES